GSAFSGRCNSGTWAAFDRRTWRTVGRETPNIRAISRLLTPCVLSSRIVVRCAWLNMRLLLGDFCGQTVKLALQAIDLLPRGPSLLAVDLGSGRARQPAGGAVHDGQCHLQIAQQFGAGGCGLGFLPLRLEKQFRLIEN